MINKSVVVVCVTSVIISLIVGITASTLSSNRLKSDRACLKAAQGNAQAITACRVGGK